MSLAVNEDIAGRLDEVARILAEQGANRFRVQAYHQAAAVLRGLARPVSEIFAEEGLAGLEKLPGVGESIARAIRDILRHGRLAMLDRLRGEHDPIALLTSVPGIGKALAWKLHDELGLESLEDLESAAHDGRLESVAGLGAKRLAGIRDSLAHPLGRIRKQPPAGRGEGLSIAVLGNAISRLHGEAGMAARGVRRQLQGRLRDIACQLTRVRYSSSPATEAWHPAINAYRCHDRILICVELAGVDRSEIQVRVEPRRVWLRGQRVPPGPRDAEGPPLQVFAMEIDHGSFEREIVLPVEVEPEQVQAEQREGLLWIRLPLTDQM